MSERVLWNEGKKPITNLSSMEEFRIEREEKLVKKERGGEGGGAGAGGGGGGRRRRGIFYFLF